MKKGSVMRPLALGFVLGSIGFYHLDLFRRPPEIQEIRIPLPEATPGAAPKPEPYSPFKPFIP